MTHTHIHHSFFLRVGITLALIALALLPAASHAQVPTLLSEMPEAGDLVRNASSSAVYYIGEDGLRYAFPNEATYFTWYEDYTVVETVSDQTLSTIQFGGLVTYRPGTRLLSPSNDPRIYAVGTAGTLRHLSSPSVAATIFGADWATRVDHIPDTFLSSYSMGTEIEDASQYNAETEQMAAQSISVNLGLKAPRTIGILDENYAEPTVHIESGTAVRWINQSAGPQTVSDNDGTWGSGTLNPGEAFTRYFLRKGIHFCHNRYDDNVGCAIHVE